MKIIIKLLFFGTFTALIVKPVYASTGVEIGAFTSGAMETIFIIASLVSVLFLIKGGYQYMISNGNPKSLESAKLTIRNAILGLVLVMASNTIASILQGAIIQTSTTSTQVTSIPNIQQAQPPAGISQVLDDAITGTLQAIVVSATGPLVKGIVGFLTTTPSLVSNQTIFHFWLIMVGIADSIFVLVIALTGLNIISANSLGYDEVSLIKILPRLIISFLGIHTSLFLMNFIVEFCNSLTSTLLNATGGLDQAWVINVFSTESVLSNNMALITLLFFAFFLLLVVIMLLMYISRLIIIALAAVLSPFVFLIWAIPRFSDLAEIYMKTFLVSVFIVFIHLTIIQLASSMLSVPGEHIKDNAFMAVLIGIGLFFTLLKTPSLMMQLIFFTKSQAIIKTFTKQAINVTSARQTSTIHEKGEA